MFFNYRGMPISSCIGNGAVEATAAGLAVSAVGGGVLAAWSFVTGDNEDAVKMAASSLFLAGASMALRAGLEAGKKQAR